MCQTLGCVARLASVNPESAATEWPFVAPWMPSAETAVRSRCRSLSRKTVDALVLRLALPAALASGELLLPSVMSAPVVLRLVDEAVVRASSALAVSLSPTALVSISRRRRGGKKPAEQRTAVIAVAAMAHAPLLAIVCAAASSERARESASAALDSMQRCLVTGASRDADETRRAERRLLLVGGALPARSAQQAAAAAAAAAGLARAPRDELFAHLLHRGAFPHLARLLRASSLATGEDTDKDGPQTRRARPTRHCQESAAAIVAAMLSHFADLPDQCPPALEPLLQALLPLEVPA